MHFSWKLILLPIYCILNVWLCDSLSRGLPQRLIICFWINTNVSVSFSCVWIWKITEILKNNFRKCWESITEQHDFNLQIILQLFYNTRSRLKCSYECKKKNNIIYSNFPQSSWNIWLQFFSRCRCLLGGNLLLHSDLLGNQYSIVGMKPQTACSTTKPFYDPIYNCIVARIDSNCL